MEFSLISDFGAMTAAAAATRPEVRTRLNILLEINVTTDLEGHNSQDNFKTCKRQKSRLKEHCMLRLLKIKHEFLTYLINLIMTNFI